MSGDGTNQIIVDGVTVVRPDGAVYFVPDAELEAYRVPEHEAAPARALLEDADEVTGFAASPEQPGIQQLVAVWGPFGRQEIAGAPAMRTAFVFELPPLKP
jgi:hypothetical protein